jgi:dTMP kinase
MFLSFEGIDGSGKSTQARLLADTLRAEGRAVVLTREPGGSAGAEEIRRLVLEGEPSRWSAETELLLFTAARRDHVERVVRPALMAGRVLISDRFADSTRIYQGTAREGGAELRGAVDALHRLMIGIEPDLTFLIDIDPAEGLARAVGRNGQELRFEDMGLAMQARMRAGFLGLAEDIPERISVVDGSGLPEAVAARVRGVLRARLGT